MNILFLLLMLALLACDAPGPLKAERNTDELFGPSEDHSTVVDAILFVGAPLPHVDLRRTAAPGIAYSSAAFALEGALVSIQQDDVIFNYNPDPHIPGRYLPSLNAPIVTPDTRYELRVVVEGEPVVRATTTTPPRMQIAEVALMDNEDLDTELRRLNTFADGNVYEAPENQLEYTVGTLEVRLQSDGDAASYQFGMTNLEETSSLLVDSDLLDDDEEDRERRETSPLLRLNDSALYMPWDGIFYSGRYTIKLFAVDQNWFDLVRTDNIDDEREAGEAGQGFQRPLFNIENGIGLFASASVDSFGFFVRPEGAPPCSGCACWGCGDRRSWSGILDTNTGMGRLRFERDVGTGDTCELSFEIVEATTIDPCPDCAFAVSFELGELTVYKDEGACEEAEGLGGTRLRLAQGNEVVAEGGGTPRFGLYAESEGIWQQMEMGWSFLLSTASQQQWLFGFSEN